MVFAKDVRAEISRSKDGKMTVMKRKREEMEGGQKQFQRYSPACAPHSLETNQHAASLDYHHKEEEEEEKKKHQISSLLIIRLNIFRTHSLM